MVPGAKIGAQSSADDDMEDGIEKHTKKSQPILELTNEDDNPAPCPKKSKHWKLSKKKTTVINSNNSSSDDQVVITKRKPNKINLVASPKTLDSDIEEIKNSKENSEDELGEC